MVRLAQGSCLMPQGSCLKVHVMDHSQENFSARAWGLGCLDQTFDQFEDSRLVLFYCDSKKVHPNTIDSRMVIISVP